MKLLEQLIGTGIRARFIRAILAKVIADGIALWQANPTYAWLLPVLLAASKALREKFPGKLEWLPV